MTIEEGATSRRRRPVDQHPRAFPASNPSTSRLHVSLVEAVPDDRPISVRIAEGRVHLSVRTPTGHALVASLSLDEGLRVLVELRNELPHLLASVHDEIEIHDELVARGPVSVALPDDSSPAAILAEWRAAEQRLAAIDEGTLAWRRVRIECDALARAYREALDARNETAADLRQPPGFATG